MKKLFILATLALFSVGFLPAQSNVDRLVRSLDSLGTVSFNNWKVSPDLKTLRAMAGDPTKPGFDDSKWDNLTLDQSIYPDSCWIRKEIMLPELILGQPTGGTVRFLTSVDDYGYLWVNGENKGYFPWDGNVELTKDAKPGQKFLIAIKACNTGGPLRLIRAEMRTSLTSSLRKTIEDLSMSLRVGQKLLGFDTYQTNARLKVDPKIDNSKIAKEENERLMSLLQEHAARLDVA